MRVPLSWLRDFAPFEGDPAMLAATLDDLGLVVEGTEHIGAGLEDVVVARVEAITAIDGADRIRRVVVDAGAGHMEVVCGAWNFEVGDLVPLAPVGAVLPGGSVIARRKMKGVTSDGMLCSGRELGLSEDHEGILVLGRHADVHADPSPPRPGQNLADAVGIEPDVVFDIAVEANRPDALSVAGVARDLAARLGLPFSIPTPPVPPESGDPVEAMTTVQVEDTELCPRFTARVLTGVAVGPSPRWLARRLALAGMRPINNVVDASNYVMLELGQPTHPYDLDRLVGGGLIVRRAVPGERLTTLDGIERVLGRPGAGLGDTGQDCLICDAHGTPVAIGGVMGGASCEITDTTRRVLVEAAYFVPMAVARTAKRLNLRTEASARFERGCDPAGIDRAVDRLCQLLGTGTTADATVAPGRIDIRGEVPRPIELTVRASRVDGLLGAGFGTEELGNLLEPLGFEVTVSDGETVQIVVPTYRPDIRPAPMGEADIAEEVARTYGYARLPRRTPSWPQPGRLTPYQRDRRLIKSVLCGLGASEAWTPTFVTLGDNVASGVGEPYVEVTNPLSSDERFLRTSMMAGLLRAVQYNSERRNGQVRLFEVGSVFLHPETVPADPEDGPAVGVTERLSAVFCGDGDDAWSAVAAWHVVAEALRLADGRLWTGEQGVAPPTPMHPGRNAVIASAVRPRSSWADGPDQLATLGTVGELDPRAVDLFGLLGSDGRPRRVGWLDLDLGRILDRTQAPRRSDEARAVSRFPSSDIDLAFAVDESVAAGTVARTLRRAGGDELESVTLFDVYRGDSVGEGARGLAYHLRFCSLDHTLTDQEMGERRAACIAAVEQVHKAVLR